MKSFKEYLIESKRTYEFKIKVAGECPKDCGSKIKEALSAYKVVSCSSGKGVPISEKQTDFPQLENVGVTIFDVVVSYPANTVQVREAVANKINVVPAKIRVRNMKEEEELELNHEHDNAEGSLLEKDYEASAEGQKVVGETQKMALLKELGKMKTTTGTEYEAEGAYPKTSASKAPGEKIKAPAVKQNNKSPVAGKKAKLTPVKG